MGNSNVKKIRKSLAAELESEILTINTLIENVRNLPVIDKKQLTKLSYHKLVTLRDTLNSVHSNIERCSRWICDGLEDISTAYPYETVKKTALGIEVSMGEYDARQFKDEAEQEKEEQPQRNSDREELAKSESEYDGLVNKGESLLDNFIINGEYPEINRESEMIRNAVTAQILNPSTKRLK